MSMTASPGAPTPSQGTGSLADIVTQLQGINKNLSNWARVFAGRTVFGSATLGAAATTVVPNAAVASTSKIALTPRNAAAGTLVGSAKSPYISAISPGISFTIATASGAAAAGGELFDYTIDTPL